MDVAVVNSGEADVMISNLAIGFERKRPMEDGRIFEMNVGADANLQLPDCGPIQPPVKPFLLRAGETTPRRLFSTIDGQSVRTTFMKDGTSIYPTVGYCRIDSGSNRRLRQYLGTVEFDRKAPFAIGLSDLFRDTKEYALMKEDVGCGPEINGIIQLDPVYK